ncbi:hypothetical protein T439DRAFT_327913 [Meredithblackwellia eburnea MCA 4105]
MPKSTKHKKARVADFAKAKLKLGKGKQLANNATNTNFTTKTIPLPAQSLETNVDAATPVSKRSLALPALLIQAHHYSPSVRTLALSEITLLLTSHPSLISQHRLQVFNSIERGIEDPVKAARDSWRNIMHIMLEQVDSRELGMTGGRLVLRTLSALSSLDEAVRIDGLALLDLLLDKIPHDVVGEWSDGKVGVEGIDSAETGNSGGDEGAGAKTVEALLGVLRVRNKGFLAANGTYTTASSSSDLTPSARLAVLRTLSTFLQTALYPSPIQGSSTNAHPPWYLRPSFKTSRAYEAFSQSLSPSTSQSQNCYALCVPSTSQYTLNSLVFPSSSNAYSVDTQTGAPGQTQIPRASLLTLLNPTILSTFLDSAPTAFAPSLEGQGNSTSEAHLATITAVVSVARSLYWLELGGVQQQQQDFDHTFAGDRSAVEAEKERERTVKMLLTFLGHVGVYFPFSVGGDEEGVARSAEAEDRLLQLNLTFASLVALLPSSSTGPSRRATTKSLKAKKVRKMAEGDEKIETLVRNVEEWVISALKGEVTSSRYPMGIPLSRRSYQDLEPTLWELLNRETLERGTEPQVLTAVLDHFGRLGAGETKEAAFAFISRLVLLQAEPAYVGRFVIRDGVRETDAVGKWLLALPKYLWELGVKNPQTSLMVMSVLHRVGAQGEQSLFLPTVFNALVRVLPPFFNLQHPSRGSIKGPFTNLPEEVKRYSVDTVKILLSGMEGCRRGDDEEKLTNSVRRSLKGEGSALVARWEW